MAIPDFQSLMLPIMKVAEDGAEHTARELRQRIGDDLGLTDAERKELLPSGTQPVLTNRIARAVAGGRPQSTTAAIDAADTAAHYTPVDLMYHKRLMMHGCGSFVSVKRTSILR